MRKTMKRLISMLLAVLLVSSLSVAVFAAGSTGGVDVNHGFHQRLDGGAPTKPADTIRFVPLKGYTLEPASGTILNDDGSVDVLLKDEHVVMDKVPAKVPADKFYEVKEWAMKDENGKLVKIDLANKTFKDGDEVYAIYEDTWKPYNDMKQDRTDWFYEYVRDLSIAEVVAGYPGYTFKPQGNVTWGEALKMIMLSVNYEEQAPLAESHWASGYLERAKKDNLVDEKKDVDLDAPITRLEYAEVASKAMKLQDVKMDSPFTDTDAQAVLNLYDAKIVEGSFDANNNRVFCPDDHITRAELSTIIWRIMEK